MEKEASNNKIKKVKTRPLDQDYMSLVKKLRKEEPESSLPKILTKASKQWRKF